MVRTYIKKVHAAIEARDQKLAEEAFKSAQPIIDRMADKGLLHKNKASRHKSRLMTQIKKMAAWLFKTLLSPAPFLQIKNIWKKGVTRS